MDSSWTGDALGLVGGEGTCLAQHLVDQRGLAVVDVGDDRDVAQIGAGQRGHAEGLPGETIGRQAGTRPTRSQRLSLGRPAARVVDGPRGDPHQPLGGRGAGGRGTARTHRLVAPCCVGAVDALGEPGRDEGALDAAVVTRAMTKVDDAMVAAVATGGSPVATYLRFSTPDDADRAAAMVLAAGTPPAVERVERLVAHLTTAARSSR